MQLSFSDDDSVSCRDLLCDEQSESLDEETPESPQEVTDFPEDSDESIAGFIEGEASYSPAIDYPARLRSSSLDPLAREQSVSWILQVQGYYDFQPLTAYLAVNYMDRFLSSHSLPEVNGWPLQLLTVACLSLAAKMEETLVPSLLDLQVEGTRFIFESRTIRRMELLVLAALNWRLRSVTPFTFIDFFACKVDSSGAFTRYLVSRATQIILSTIKDIDFLNQCPSSMAAAAIIHATSELPDLRFINPGMAVKWCIGLTREGISNCCKLMQDVRVEKLERKAPKILPHLRVTTPPHKRRKLDAGESKEMDLSSSDEVLGKDEINLSSGSSSGTSSSSRRGE